MNKFNSVDFHRPDRTANFWYMVDGVQYAISFTAIQGDSYKDAWCNVSLLDADGYPIDDGDQKSIFNELRIDAISRMADELDADQIALVNAESLIEPA